MSSASVDLMMIDSEPVMAWEPSTERPPGANLDTVPDDLNNATHKRLDAEVLKTNPEILADALSSSDSPAALAIAQSLLATIASTSEGRLDPKYNDVLAARALLQEHPELMGMLQEAWKARSFKDIRNLKLLRRPTRAQFIDLQREGLDHKLQDAYNVPYIGPAAVDFTTLLLTLDEMVRNDDDEKPAYAKAISIAQSSGTGKSRMLTEAGGIVFTIPICLRAPDAPGYPRSDEAVFRYFKTLPKHNDMSITAHIGVAAFLASLHETTLAWLMGMSSRGVNKDTLFSHWHELMERRENYALRQEFFSQVVKEAKIIAQRPIHTTPPSGASPQRNTDKSKDFDMKTIARQIYLSRAKTATECLVNFISSFGGKSTLCVTYFDEADELKELYWIMLRLANQQDASTPMWYVFMSTKLSATLWVPIAENRNSQRLRDEMRTLFPPFFALGFDQHMIIDSGKVTCATIGQLQSVEHLCKYGRPLWKALHEIGMDVVKEAKWKLTNYVTFNASIRDHVFAVLSQRLCLEPVLAGREALELADRSVSHHMRLLTGISSDLRQFKTDSPSEPILVLAAAKWLPTEDATWAKVLGTLNKDLFEAGLVEKGLIGEFCARTLLLIARDFTAPRPDGSPDLLVPVRLLAFLDELFGDKSWCGNDRRSFEETFEKAYVNFTHWIITKDPLPLTPDPQLLANLWARGAALQCCFNQESIDFLIPFYKSSIEATAIFDPAALSGVVGQIKHKGKGDGEAGRNLSPMGIPFNPSSGPPPFIALLLELGSEAFYRSTKSKIQHAKFVPDEEVQFQSLRAAWLAAQGKLKEHLSKKAGKRGLHELQVAVKEARQAMDRYNQWSIFARGASPEVYGILDKAKITADFQALLGVTSPSPRESEPMVQQMLPLERLGSKSPYTAWMRRFVSDDPEGDDQGSE